MAYAPPIQLSTAISDAVLALVSIAAALPVLKGTNPSRRFAGVCLLFIGLTAGIGAARFGGAHVAVVHDSMSWTSKMIVLPALGAAFVALSYGLRIIRPYWYGVSLVFAAVGYGLPAKWGLLPGVSAMACIFWVSARHFRSARPVAVSAGLGAGLMMLVGLVVGTQGYWGPVPRVDLFHYGLAVAHLLFAYALVGLPSPMKDATAEG